MHRAINVVWPRALGTTPAGVARALTVHSASRGVRYRWRLARCGDRLADVATRVAAGWPVAMLIGAMLPRHWVLLTEIDGVGHPLLRAVLRARCWMLPIDDIRRRPAVSGSAFRGRSRSSLPRLVSSCPSTQVNAVSVPSSASDTASAGSMIVA